MVPMDPSTDPPRLSAGGSGKVTEIKTKPALGHGPTFARAHRSIDVLVDGKTLPGSVLTKGGGAFVQRKHQRSHANVIPSPGGGHT